jgi:hypothetical protein
MHKLQRWVSICAVLASFLYATQVRASSINGLSPSTYRIDIAQQQEREVVFTIQRTESTDVISVDMSISGTGAPLIVPNTKYLQLSRGEQQFVVPLTIRTGNTPRGSYEILVQFTNTPSSSATGMEVRTAVAGKILVNIVDASLVKTPPVSVETNPDFLASVQVQEVTLTKRALRTFTDNTLRIVFENTADVPLVNIPYTVSTSYHDTALAERKVLLQESISPHETRTIDLPTQAIRSGALRVTVTLGDQAYSVNMFAWLWRARWTEWLVVLGFASITGGIGWILLRRTRFGVRGDV